MSQELYSYMRSVAVDVARANRYNSGVEYAERNRLQAAFDRIERLCAHVGNRSLRDARLELCVDIAELSLKYNHMDFRDQAARSEVYTKLTDALDLLSDMDLVRDEIHAEAAI
jgi:hypothetical protein